MRNYIVIYTDGSCYQGKGGFGTYIEFHSENLSNKCYAIKKINGGYIDTTISRMELRAIIEGLKAIKVKDRYETLVISDSEYIINSIEKGWLETWELQNFSGRVNSDLWKEFLIEKRKFPIHLLRFKHTRGHGKGFTKYEKGNNIADELADYKQFKKFEKDKIDPIKAEKDKEKLSKNSIYHNIDLEVLNSIYNEQK